ncbi:hypothetical protein QTP88_011774 [Uroleucon formosanum]
MGGPASEHCVYYYYTYIICYIIRSCPLRCRSRVNEQLKCSMHPDVPVNRICVYPGVAMDMNRWTGKCITPIDVYNIRDVPRDDHTDGDDDDDATTTVTSTATCQE